MHCATILIVTNSNFLTDKVLLNQQALNPDTDNNNNGI
jgi:hypothetical protein